MSEVAYPGRARGWACGVEGLLGRLPAGGMRASQGTFSSIELLLHEYLYTYENAFLIYCETVTDVYLYACIYKNDCLA